jgi:hypothetical protein
MYLYYKNETIIYDSISFDTTICPCCNYKLRTRSFRGFDMRKKHREEIINGYRLHGNQLF